MALNSKHQKVSGSSQGKVGRFKKDGYASSTPEDTFVGTKVGKTDKVGYSGPNVAKTSRGDA